MRFEIVTLFPELFEVLNTGLLGKAREAGRIDVHTITPRRFTTDRHRTVDDAPYGGGSGMVLMPGPIADALDYLDEQRGGRISRRVLLTPQGARFTQAHARRFAGLDSLTLVDVDSLDPAPHARAQADIVRFDDARNRFKFRPQLAVANQRSKADNTDDEQKKSASHFSTAQHSAQSNRRQADQASILAAHGQLRICCQPGTHRMDRLISPRALGPPSSLRDLYYARWPIG